MKRAGEDSAETQLPDAVLVTGFFGPEIGGPYHTLVGYREALRSCGRNVPVVMLGSVRDSVARFSVWRAVPGLLRELRARSGGSYVFFGVWHAAFLIGLPFVRLCCNPKSVVLVPTQSLSPVDWRKHVSVKALLRPLIALLVGMVDLTVFATSGERAEAKPWRNGWRAQVVFEPIARPNLSPGGQARQPHKMAILGRIHPQKDHKAAVDTLALLPDWRLSVIGDGDRSYVLDLKRYAASCGVAHRIEWHGWLDREEALTTVARSQVLIVTSAAENYCHAAVEAMYVGTPVVMMDRIASTTDFARLGCATICSSTPEAVAQAVLDVVRSPKTAEMVRLGRAFAERQAGPLARAEVIAAIAGAETRRHAPAGR